MNLRQIGLAADWHRRYDSAMHRRPHWLSLVLLLASSSLLAGAVAGHPDPARAADPPPIWSMFLPVVMTPFHTYVPNVANDNGVPSAQTFLGMNGGSIDGGAGTGAYPGQLAYFPPPRAKSFRLLGTGGLHSLRN